MTPAAPDRLGFTSEQSARLRDLGAEEDIIGQCFERTQDRDAVFLQAEAKLSSWVRDQVRQSLAKGGRPATELLIESVAEVLSSMGLVQVSTPIIMSRARLVRMGLENDPLLAAQVFWLDPKRCLRPMLAPHLYEYMLDLSRLATDPYGIFEIGPCFRKESRGARHANEFTMLNLVEVGLPVEKRRERLSQLAGVVLDNAGIKDWRLEQTQSTVYGSTIDVVDSKGLELASCSIGPHPLDSAWGFDGTWVGLGIGIERLVMAASGLERMSPVGRGLGRLLGWPLRL
ncbi:MAG: pyrrolysine--tRNA(Pyl) ligase large subunit [Deltaproteobacteria bacterium]|jgi:phenylalanyl-tRNA synthetase alpha chain|nr:pyrrolysine--tRNA(Pyl) ligase large subunit [Deltaproteobacteria bacterium]